MGMKIILDNIIYSKSKNGGISNYWFELSKYLMSETSNDLRFVEEKKELLNFHRKQLDITTDKIIYKDNPILLFNRLLPIEYNSNEKFIYHSSFYRKLIGSKKHIEITTVHDFTHDFYAPFVNKKIHNWLKYNAIKRSKGVICISKNTYTDLKRFCPTNKNQKVEVIYNGVSDDYFPIKNYSFEDELFLNNFKINDEFLLYVGSRTNYKNCDFVTRLINEVKNYKLVVVGGGGFSNREAKLFTQNTLKNRIVHIESVTNSELNILYNKAHAFIYPSNYEGFGIPIIEAMRAGCPVVAFDNAINQEITENKALLLKNLSTHDFLEKMEQLSNVNFRNELIGKGFELSKKYSWYKCCKETNEFYESLY